MTTITAIADAAFDAVNAAITDVIDDATLTSTTQYEHGYDAIAGEHATTTTTYTGRGLFDTTTPAQDIFGDFTQGPREQMVVLEGFTVAAKEGWKLTINSIDYTVQRAQTVAGSVSLQYAVVLKK